MDILISPFLFLILKRKRRELLIASRLSDFGELILVFS
ncbi:hypothetical protein O163_11450 [Caldanaerobacter subterraneus subsp. yonseiensis KB-1]|uniref:Uncharacterized protein n=1 Tax=Caldanaerobacter subterraneus subsp. yonseiensis KB-1 TaxID=1388761 RepID=U5CE88_CALSX|nr:hypothetical protein O163_11450 [Caldanaerobacter subterraneus subsp. yonseiensis KB-1]